MRVTSCENFTPMSLAARPLGCHIVDLLAANGIDTVFGIPGVHNLALYRGLDRRRGLRHVLVRHEQGAAFAADGHARITGRPAAAFVISGPGVTNALTAVAQARSDSVPLIIVASTPTGASLGRGWGLLHELKDQHGVMDAVLDLTCTARSAEEAQAFLRRVFEEYDAGRMRPAYLGVPLDVLALDTDLPVEAFEGAGRPQPAPAQVERIAALLAAVERPLFIAGGGARGAAHELRALIERLDGYLVTTAAGKGLLPEAHPANLGCSLPYAPTQRLIAEADVVVAVGTGLSETDIYTADRQAVRGKLVRVDIRAVADERHPATESVCSDAAPFLAALAAKLAKRSAPTPGWRKTSGDAAAQRAAIDAAADAPTRVMRQALEALRTALPADAVVFSDMTQIAYLGNYAFPMDAPGAWHHPSGYGTLGFALPAALGAKIAAPQRPVLALHGDFGLQFTVQELGTAVEAGLSLPIVVWNNAALGQIRDDMIASGIGPLGVFARNPDFVALAEAWGARGVRVGDGAGLTAAIEAALRHPGPTLIEVDAAAFSAAFSAAFTAVGTAAVSASSPG
jgi:5-guanidino-2-oxopentanoate decarboxylase